MSATASALGLRARASVDAERLFAPLALTTLVAAAGLWLLSLPAIHLDEMGKAGLAGVAPFSWYVAVVLLVGGTVVLSLRRGSSALLVAMFLIAVAAVLYGTVPAISPEPAYAWTYKHVGVTHLIMATGSVNLHGDIYNRWPGMFALAAAFSRLTGIDPLSYAGWFEPFVTVLDMLIVAAIAHSIVRDRRVTALASLLFLVTNWIGQDYFSPQATSFALSLVLMLVVLRQFPQRGALRGKAVRLMERMVGTKQPEAAPDAIKTWSRSLSIGVVLALQAAIAATHQLTPYMVILEIGALTLIGLRPRLLLVAVTFIALAYLAPNFSFIQSHYGLLNGLNPLDSAQAGSGVPTHQTWLYAHLGGYLSIISLLLSGVGFACLARTGHGSKALTVGVLAVAPFATLFLNNYGGEGVLRVSLFSAPWQSILIAWALCTIGRRRALVASLTVVGLLASLFVFAFAGYEQTSVIPKGEVQASEYFNANAPAGSVLEPVADGFPTRIGARYVQMNLAARLPVLYQRSFTHGWTGAALTRLAGSMLSDTQHAYIVFSASERTYLSDNGIASPRRYALLEWEVATSPLFRLWYSNADTEIYQVWPGTCSVVGRCSPSATLSPVFPGTRLSMGFARTRLSMRVPATEPLTSSRGKRPTASSRGTRTHTGSRGRHR